MLLYCLASCLTDAVSLGFVQGTYLAPESNSSLLVCVMTDRELDRDGVVVRATSSDVTAEGVIIIVKQQFTSFTTMINSVTVWKYSMYTLPCSVKHKSSRNV